MNLSEQVEDLLNQYCNMNNINREIIIENPIWQDDKTKNTFAMFLAKNKIFPPIEYIHDPLLTNSQNFTVAIILELNGLNTPIEWRYDPKIIIDKECCETTAMILSKNGCVPNDQWTHIPQMQNYQQNTVAMLLAENDIYDIPYQWIHEPQIQNSKLETVAIKLAQKGRQICSFWTHKPFITDIDGNTVALTYAFKGMIPNKEWNHTKYLKNKKGFTVYDHLAFRNIDIPPNWMIDKDVDMQQMIQYYLETYCKIYNIKDYKIIIDNPGYQQEINGIKQQTFAMFLADNKIIPPKQFYHDPNIRFNNETVALKLIQKQIIPEEQWNHDPSFQNNKGYTVAMLLTKMKQTDRIPPKQWEHNPSIQNKRGMTVAMYLASFGIIPPKQWEHDPNMRNINGDTVAMWLSSTRCVPPPQWYHEPTFQGFNKTTVAMELAMRNLQIDNHWYHDPNIFSYDGNSVAYYLAYNEHIPGEQWKVDPTIKYKDIIYQSRVYKTIAMQLASKGIVPSDLWKHDPTLQDNYGFTVQDYLVMNGVKDIPRFWQIDHNPLEKSIMNHLYRYCLLYKIQKQYVKTETQGQHSRFLISFPMYLAIEAVVPPKQFWHKPDMTTYSNQTVALLLAYKGIIPPKEWDHRSDIVNDDKATVALSLARNGLIPPKEWYHKPDLQDKQNCTVAMYLAKEGITPPKEWYHDPNLINSNGNTVAHCFAENGHIPPKEWTINPQIKNNQGNTIALLLAQQGIVPPQEYVHDPYLLFQENILNKNEFKYNTVAMLLAYKEIMPPIEWQHNKYIRNPNGQTVYDILTSLNIPISDNWKIDQSIFIDNQFNTKAHLSASQGIIPDENDYCNPYCQNKQGYTVAMYLAENNIDIPEKWVHNKFLVNKDGFTVQQILILNKKEVPECWRYDVLQYLNKSIIKKLTNFCKQNNTELQTIIKHPETQLGDQEQTFAMYLLKNNIFVPPEFYHDPLIKDTYNNTISILLTKQGIIPNKYLIHDIDIINKQDESLKSNLLKYNYIWMDNQFIFNIQYENIKDTCTICFNDQQQDFIISNCHHRVCKECFKQLYKAKNYTFCPVCYQPNWIKPLDKQQFIKQIIENQYQQ